MMVSLRTQMKTEKHVKPKTMKPKLGGGFKYFIFSPLPGEDEPNLTHIFQMGWFNHQPVNHV